jgi:hypothetical protein
MVPKFIITCSLSSIRFLGQLMPQGKDFGDPHLMAVQTESTYAKASATTMVLGPEIKDEFILS